jgi:hypothetical protein
MTAQRKDEMDEIRHVPKPGSWPPPPSAARSEPITLQDARTAKGEAENAIREALDKFIKATGLTVDDVRFDTLTFGGIGSKSTQTISAVRLAVRL